MKHTIEALAAGICLSLISVVSVFAWGSRIEGRPASFEAGWTRGVYFWHEADDGLHLRTTDALNKAHHYTGTITTDGTFVGLTTVKLDGSDSATIDGSGHSLSFDFTTFSGIDGIDYFIQGGSQQVLDLQLDGHQLPVDNIYLGAYSVHPEHDPLVVYR
ncbi:MAG TPA: hypothetical protein VK821_19105 [Dehalococcoidia bacterium]|nr:hypothetical protein [Dehalococcoidia bacterium]